MNGADKNVSCPQSFITLPIHSRPSSYPGANVTYDPLLEIRPVIFVFSNLIWRTKDTPTTHSRARLDERSSICQIGMQRLVHDQNIFLHV